MKIKPFTITIRPWMTILAICCGLLYVLYWVSWDSVWYLYPLFAYEVFMNPEETLEYHKHDPIRDYLVYSAHAGLFFWKWWSLLLLTTLAALGIRLHLKRR